MTATLSNSSDRTVNPPPPNTVLADLQNAIESYPQTHLTVEIYDVNPPGGTVNENDNVTFKVRVSNSGPLDVDALTLLVKGLNGTTVRKHSATVFTSTITSAVFGRLPAHQPDAPVDTPDDHYHFTAPSARPLADLVDVSIKDWNADVLAHLFNSHSDPDPAAHDVYSSAVFVK